MNQIATRTSVLVIDGQALANTLDIATMFGKRHDNVLQATRKLMADLPEEYRLLNFKETFETRTNPKGGAPISSPAYNVTRDGFVLLAMGFTGRQALQFKIAYIEEFNRMEAALRGEYVKLSPAQRRELQNAVSERAYALGGTREDFASVYRILKDHFKVPTYADIPASKFAEALELIETAPRNVPLLKGPDTTQYIVQQAQALAKQVQAYYGVVDVKTYTLAQDITFRMAFA